MTRPPPPLLPEEEEDAPSVRRMAGLLARVLTALDRPTDADDLLRHDPDLEPEPHH